ncbi:protein NEDD1-like [Euwallacea fornicatus]|uniref:protein NEDD1-like n=1 Tax=Euwallacea fornicatus TaxID=995702 RepID=UPI00338D8CEC
MYIASSSSVVKFHEFPSNRLAHTYQPNSKIEGSCRSLSWTKDGGWLAIVPYSGCAEIVSLKGQCKVFHTLYDISEPSCACFQNLTKRNVAVGTKHGQVLLYDVKSRSIKARYPRVRSAITHVGFTAKDTHCYAGCASGEVFLFNQLAKNLSCTLKVPKSLSLTALKAHVQKRNFLTAGSDEGIVCVWDVNVNKVKFQTDAHNAPVSSTIFSPVNASLVVSSGLDRVVRVFDIESNSRISTIPVENNVLSLDFLQDSLHIAMGCQNGKIHIYDTRKFQDPVHSFQAHKRAVKLLTYQNYLNDTVVNNSSMESMAHEELPAKTNTSHNEVLEKKEKRTSEFFGLMTESPFSAREVLEDKPQSKLSVDCRDSFMIALSFDKNDDSGKAEQAEVDHQLPLPPTTNKPLNSFTPKLIPEKPLDPKSALKASSTPIFPMDHLVKNLSPIVGGSSSCSCQNINIADIRTAIQSDMKKEMKKIEEMESKFSDMFMRHTHQIRRMVLDLHMSTLKEFIKVENYCNLIRDEISIEPQSIKESHLLEENFSLKKRIRDLEKHVASLSACQVEKEPLSDENSNK